MKMKVRLLRPLTVIAAIASVVALSSEPSAAASKFDGTWFVRMVAKSGSCPESSFPIQVSEGVVSLPGFGAMVNGAVRRNGSVTLSISHAMQSVKATGTVAGSNGSGRWHSPTASCDGTWTARRH